MSRYQKSKTNLDFTEARDSEWQWLQLGYMQVCTSLQTDNHASTPPLSFLQAGYPSCRPTNSIKALKALTKHSHDKGEKKHRKTHTTHKVVKYTVVKISQGGYRMSHYFSSLVSSVNYIKKLITNGQCSLYNYHENVLTRAQF